MRAFTPVAVVVLLCAACASAAVIDGFEGGAAWVNNYTNHGSSITWSSVLTGQSGQGPSAGVHLGNAILGGQQVGTSVHKEGQGAVNVSSGDSASVMVYGTGPNSWNAGGLVVKTFAGGAYVAILSEYSNNTRLSIGAHDLTSGAGTPVYSWGGGMWLANHTGAVKNFPLAGSVAGWYKIDATYTEVGNTNVIAVTVTDPGGITYNTSYTDSGTAAPGSQGAGDIGIFDQPWANANDFDELSYVPEPAALALLVLGGVAALRRRRRR